MKRYKSVFKEKLLNRVNREFGIQLILDSEDDDSVLYGHIEMIQPNSAPVATSNFSKVKVKDLLPLYEKLEKICEKEIKLFFQKHK